MSKTIEEIRETKRIEHQKWVEKNRAREREINSASKKRRYYANLEANREKSRIRCARWRKKNAERARETGKRHYYKHHERSLAKARKWHHANRDKIRERFRRYTLRRLYGITVAQYEEMGSGCHICGIEFDPNDKKKAGKQRHRLAVDHDRVTGKIRGKLCSNCNTGIGLFRHDLGLLLKAMEYLDRTRDGFKFKPAA